MSELPVVVIGAGPRLAGPTHLLERGMQPCGARVGRRPWNRGGAVVTRTDLLPVAGTGGRRSRTIALPLGWAAPSTGYPSGGEWISGYLTPLADALGDRVRYRTRVTGVSRQGHDRVLTKDRDDAPFVVHVVDHNRHESTLSARAVIDASGTWSQPNPAGADGLPALGERDGASAGVVTYAPPAPENSAAWAGEHVVIVGSGHSAMTAVIELAEVARQHTATRVTWVLRRGTIGSMLGGGESDALPQRGALGARAHAAVDAGLVQMVTGFRTERIAVESGRATMIAEDWRALAPADHVVSRRPVSGPIFRSCRNCAWNSIPCCRRRSNWHQKSTPTCIPVAVCPRTAPPNWRIPKSRDCSWSA